MEELKKQPVTVSLILINILVFLAVELTGGSEDTMHMLQCGAGYTPAIIQGEYYRIFTSMFLHFGPQHLGNNMLGTFCTWRKTGTYSWKTEISSDLSPWRNGRKSAVYFS